MALTRDQIIALLNEARTAGLDPDDLEAVEWVLLDQAAELDGATRLDMALALAPQPETDAADRFMVESQQLRREAFDRGITEMKAMTEEEWEMLING